MIICTICDYVIMRTASLSFETNVNVQTFGMSYYGVL